MNKLTAYWQFGRVYSVLNIRLALVWIGDNTERIVTWMQVVGVIGAVLGLVALMMLHIANS